MRLLAFIFLILSFQSFGVDNSQICALPDKISETADAISAATSMLSRDSFAIDCPIVAPYPDKFPGVSNIHQLKNQVEAKFRSLGINIRWDQSRLLGLRRAYSHGAGRWKPFLNTPADIARLKRVANIMYASLSLYPREVFSKVGLRSVYIAKDLEVGDQMRKAMPAPETGALLYADNGLYPCDVGMEERIHHEFFHYMEGRVHGNMRANLGDWSALNPEYFEYGNGGASVYNCAHGFRNNGHVRNGFVSRYALSAPEEDRAETYAWMMTRGFSSQMQTFIETDPVLGKKRDLIQNFVRENMSQGMNAEFFQEFRSDFEAPRISPK